MQKRKYLKVIIFVLCISTSLVVFAIPKIEGYELLWTIPLVFGISNLIFEFLNPKYYNGVGSYVLFIMMSMKYVLMPLLTVITKSYYGTAIGYGIQPEAKSVEFGIFLIIYECITIFIINKIYKMHIYRSKNNIYNDVTNKKSTYKILIILGILLLLLIINYLPRLITDNFLVINEEVTQSNIDGEFSGIYSIIYFFARVFLFVGIVEYLSQKYNKKTTLNIAIIYIIVSIIYLGLNTGLSRWAMLIPAIQMMYIAIKIFHKNRKFIILILGLVALISIISISAYRFSNGEENTLSDTLISLSKSMQSYLSGPRNVALAVEMSDVYDKEISGFTVINSMFSSVPLASNYVNVNDRFAKYYNDYLFGANKWEDQIIPSLGEGYALFGIIGCNIFIALYVIGCIYCDNKMRYVKDVKYLFVYSYITIRLATSLGLNMAIVSANIIGKMIPLIVIFKIIDLIGAKSKEIEGDKFGYAYIKKNS